MKHWAIFAVLMVLLTTALTWSEITKPSAPVSPEPILNLIADN